MGASILLSQLMQGLPVRLERGSGELLIAQVTDDSRLAIEGSLFIARPGSSADGARFIADAIQRGARAILAEQPVETPPGIALLIGGPLASLAGRIAETFHGHPAAKLKLLAVTGTNGKTTTAFLVRHLLRRAGLGCGLIGTIEIDDGSTAQTSQLTTPGAIEMSGLLARMVANGCTHCVMETSSHALDQGRVDALDFAAAAFTNLTGDHLDYHKTMDAYAGAKARLFERLSPGAAAILNSDDPAWKRMARNCRAAVLRFSQEDPQADLYASILSADAGGTRCLFKGPWGQVEAMMPLIGVHNVANMLGALGLAWAAGAKMEPARLAQAIEQCPQVPGRLEPVMAPGVKAPFVVVVDYAHTDDALANVLRALKPLTRGRLRVLFGCGGDRDNTKRPRMARTAAELADDLIITSDNPRTENPASIIDQIVAGLAPADLSRARTIEDRALAIRRIVQDAGPGDVLLLAGKGHEDYQIIGKQKHPFDDRLHAAEAIRSRLAAQATAG